MATSGRGPRRSSEKEGAWRRLVKEWRQSGETALVFAQGRGLSAWTLRWWSSELKKRDAEKKPEVGRAEAVLPRSRSLSPAVVPVRIAGTDSRQEVRKRTNQSARIVRADWTRVGGLTSVEPSRGVIEIVRFGRVRIRLPVDIDVQALRTLLDVLEARC